MPLIFSVVTSTSLPLSDLEYCFTNSLDVEVGTKACNFCVPSIILAWENLSSQNCHSLFHSSVVEYEKSIPLIFSTANLYYCWGVMIWSSWVLCKLALAASLLTVPPVPSQGPLPWEFAKKCHSAAIPSKSCLWWHRLMKFLQSLYWVGASSLKYIICLTG